MINDILKELVDTSNIVAFIDNVMVTTDSEKEHNKFVKEVLKRIEKNNLHVKMEKYQ